MSDSNFGPDISSLNDFLASETDPDALCSHVQEMARRVYQEFEQILESHGPLVVERLMPILVTVLEKLDELYKDQAAYKAEVVQLREDKASLLSELGREKSARKESENVSLFRTTAPLFCNRKMCL